MTQQPIGNAATNNAKTTAGTVPGTTGGAMLSGAGAPLGMIYTAHSRPWQKSAYACVLISATFCLLIALYMLALWSQERQDHPLVNRQITDLKQELLNHPENDTLKQQIRQADAHLRGTYWSRRTALQQSTWLLLAGAGILVLSLKTHRLFTARPPTRDALGQPVPPDERPAQWAVAGVGVTLGLTMIVGVAWAISTGHSATNFRTPATVTESAESRPSPAPIASIFPSTTDLRRNWPVFRGWGAGAMTAPGKLFGTAIVPAAAWPTTWDVAKNQNILWKTPLDLPGNNSPVVWQNRIFLSGASAKDRQITCYDLSTGQKLWQTPLTGTPLQVDVNDDTGYAAPTMAVDGQHAYAIFATGDIAAVDFSGKLLWQRNLGKPESQYGYAASLTLAKTATSGVAVIVQWDVGSDTIGSRSALLALDALTGRTLWQTKRPVINSWSSPIVAEVAGKPQIICAGNPLVAGYDPATGQELWRAEGLSSDVGPSPVCINNIVYIAQDNSIMAAISADLSGDITASGIKWQKNDVGRPDLVSPACDGSLLWTVLSNGNILCTQAADGSKVWEHEGNDSFHASPLVVNLPDSRRELWIIDIRSVLHRLDTGRAYKELGTCALGEGVSATPAFVDQKIIIRGHQNLYCIGVGKSGQVLIWPPEQSPLYLSKGPSPLNGSKGLSPFYWPEGPKVWVAGADRPRKATINPSQAQRADTLAPIMMLLGATTAHFGGTN